MNETYKYDPMTGSLVVKRTEDVTSVIEQNKRQYDVDNKSYGKEVFNHVARVPLSAIEAYCQQKGVKYEEFMNNDKIQKQFLNDPDNRFFRTKPGRV